MHLAVIMETASQRLEKATFDSATYSDLSWLHTILRGTLQWTNIHIYIYTIYIYIYFFNTHILFPRHSWRWFHLFPRWDVLVRSLKSNFCNGIFPINGPEFWCVSKRGNSYCVNLPCQASSHPTYLSYLPTQTTEHSHFQTTSCGMTRAP